MFIAFLKLTALQMLGLISPGPDFACVVRNAMLYDKRLALFTALGIALGIGVHVAYAILGLSLLLVHTPWLFRIVQYLGAAYLIYIGIKAILHKDQPSTTADSSQANTNHISIGLALRQGFFCNVLNPKAALFILGLFTLAVSAETPAWLKVFYGFWMMFTTWVWFSSLVLLIHHSYFRARLLNFQKYITKGMGILLIIFGLQLFFYALQHS